MPFQPLVSRHLRRPIAAPRPTIQRLSAITLLHLRRPFIGSEPTSLPRGGIAYGKQNNFCQIEKTSYLCSRFGGEIPKL